MDAGDSSVAATGPIPPAIQLVVKISKYCNLRCTYCYEFEELGNKARMSMDNIARMFSNLAHAIDAGRLSSVEFVWHGGEPFLIPIECYQQIGSLQREIFKNPAHYRNVTQTNLTVLTDRQVAFLKGGQFFENIGVSFDVFGDQRVDKSGALRNETVLANMQTLVDNDIGFGAISVLCRSTLAHSRRIQKFWEELGVGFRFLPFHLSIDDARSTTHGLDGREQVSALQQCFLDWLSSANAVRVDPLHEYIGYGLDYMAGGSKVIYDPLETESVYVVNTNGNVCGVGQGELYSPELCYGNLFDSSFVDILESPSRQRAVSDALMRMHSYCKECPYFGHCPGHHVADASSEDIAILETNGCTVRHVVAFIVATVEKSPVANELHSRIRDLTEAVG